MYLYVSMKVTGCGVNENVVDLSKVEGISEGGWRRRDGSDESEKDRES